MSRSSAGKNAGVSKAGLVIIEQLSLGALGVDRFYAGQPKMGMLKLGMLIGSVVFSVMAARQKSSFMGSVALLLFVGWTIFWLTDYFRVFLSAVAGNTRGTIGVKKWSNKDMSFARNLALFFIIAPFVLNFVALMLVEPRAEPMAFDFD